ncbi:TniQ family protein [Polaromonas sp.]|uniref:TniQ family protein n=1 Tax=Polaromonas sp. TaxID=1869339 RepID=UPI003753AE1A
MRIALERTLGASIGDASGAGHKDADVYFLNDAKVLTTILYGFAPRGIGTGEVETLHSHLLSLAYEHRVSPKRLVGDALSPLWQNTTSSLCTQMSWSAHGGRLMMGSAATARFWVDILQAATGRDDLDRTTFLPIAHHLNGERLFFSGPRHCQKCFENDIESGQLPYHRLAWQVRVVDCCHIHGTALVASECGLPASDQVRDRARVKLSGSCAGCRSIGHKCIDTAANFSPASSLWKARQIADLIANFDLVSQVSSSKVKAALREYHATHEGLSALARRSVIAKSALWRWLGNPQARFALPQYLKIAASEGFTLVGLMTGDLTKAAASIDAQLEKCRKPLKDIDFPAVRARLLEAMDLPIPLQHVAAEFDVSTELLRRRFPEESAEIVKLFSELQRSEFREVRRKAFHDAESVLLQLWIARKPLTHRNAGILTGSTWYPSAVRSRIFKALRGVLDPRLQDDQPECTRHLALHIGQAKTRLVKLAQEHRRSA